MANDLNDILDVLRFELNYLEQGGYERDRAELGIESPFQNTMSCANSEDPLGAHACHECLLFQFVPEDKRNEDFPCHHIRLNDHGETVAELMAQKDPELLVTALEHWLRDTITMLQATADGEKSIQAG